LQIVGPAAASSFGPVCRFVYGTQHPARHLAAFLPGVLSRRQTGAGASPALESAVLP
jgi:hypothetical protein